MPPSLPLLLFALLGNAPLSPASNASLPGPERPPIQLRVLRRAPAPASCVRSDFTGKDFAEGRVCFSPDGRYVAGWSAAGVFWFPAEGRAAPQGLELVGLPAPGRGSAEFLIASPAGLHWLDVEEETVIPADIPGIGSRPPGQAYWARLTPDGGTVLAWVDAGERHARIVRWDLATDRLRLFPREVQASPSRGRVLDLEFSEDARRLYWADARGLHETDASDRSLLRSVRGSVRFFRRLDADLALTHDGLKLFLWDLRRLEPLCHWPFDDAEDSRRLVRPRDARLRDGTVHPPRPTSTSPRFSHWVDMNATILAAALSPDRRRVALLGERDAVIFEIGRSRHRGRGG